MNCCFKTSTITFILVINIYFFGEFSPPFLSPHQHMYYEANKKMKKKKQYVEGREAEYTGKIIFT